MTYLLVFISQIFFNIFKTLEIKYTYENKINSLLLNSIWINLISLLSFYYSIESLFEGDLIIVPVYIIGSVFGKWIAMTQIDNIRNRVYQILKK